MIDYYRSHTNGAIQNSYNERNSEWISIRKPRENEINDICETYIIPRNYLTSVLDADEIARTDNLNSDKHPRLATFLFPYKVIENGLEVYRTQLMTVVLTSEKIITVSASETTFFENLIHEKYFLSLISKEYFLLETALAISYTYILYLKEIKEKISDLEKENMISNKNEQLYLLLSLKKSLVFLETGIRSNSSVVDSIENTSRFYKNRLLREFIPRLHIENMQAKSMILQYNQLLNQIGDLFSAILSNRLNNLMKLLTSISIILTIPSIIGSFWGMNVRLPFESTPFAFWLLLVLTSCISLVVALVLKKIFFTNS